MRRRKRGEDISIGGEFAQVPFKANIYILDGVHTHYLWLRNKSSIFTTVVCTTGNFFERFVGNNIRYTGTHIQYRIIINFVQQYRYVKDYLQKFSLKRKSANIYTVTHVYCPLKLLEKYFYIAVVINVQ